MKSIIAKATLLLTFCTALFSFTKFGGEGYEIYLNNKVMIQKYGNAEMNAIQSLQLSQGDADDQIVVKYHHCGKVAKSRVLTIKDGQNKVLKQFNYADIPSPMAGMALNVKELFSLKKGSNGTFHLYYSSSELPHERLLTTILI